MPTLDTLPAAILARVKEAVRNPYVWPGGYPIYTLMADGEFMCLDCVRKNWRAIVASTREHMTDGWRAEGTMIYWEGAPDHCSDCGKELESAYGDPDSGD